MLLVRRRHKTFMLLFLRQSDTGQGAQSDTAYAPDERFLGYMSNPTVEQAEDNRTSLATQESAIRGLAMIHGIPDVTIFSDPGISGSIPLNERPAGSRLTAA